MLFYFHKYLFRFLQRTVVSMGLLLAFEPGASAQTNDPNNQAGRFLLNPILHFAFKKPVTTNPLLAAHIKPTKYELMYWPNYPLTAAQIAVRDKKYDKSVGQQITGEIVDSYINSLLYGKKKPAAAIPKF